MLMVCNVSSCDWYMVRLAGVQELIELLTCTSSLFLLLHLLAPKTLTKVTISRRTMLCSSYGHPATLEDGKLFSSCSIVTWLDKACCKGITELLQDSVRRQFSDVFLACCDKPSNSAAAREKTAHTCLANPKTSGPCVIWCQWIQYMASSATYY